MGFLSSMFKGSGSSSKSSSSKTSKAADKVLKTMDRIFKDKKKSHRKPGWFPNGNSSLGLREHPGRLSKTAIIIIGAIAGALVLLFIFGLIVKTRARKAARKKSLRETDVEDGVTVGVKDAAIGQDIGTVELSRQDNLQQYPDDDVKDPSGAWNQSENTLAAEFSSSKQESVDESCRFGNIGEVGSVIASPPPVLLAPEKAELHLGDVETDISKTGGIALELESGGGEEIGLAIGHPLPGNVEREEYTIASEEAHAS
ncbi:hypothetical protein ABW19_dt0200560 [Dactylella cylindrospora]|nr:hypothetical protein ABW19_dt0200560 [Dactylella cylindrospora]